MIEQLSKNRLSELRKLQQKKFRQLQGEVIVEGERLIKQIMNDGVTPEALFCTEDYISSLKRLSPIAESIESYLISELQKRQLSTTQTPQEIFALVKLPRFERVEGERLLYLDRISEPGNVGTIFRTAQALGIDGVILSPDCCEVFNPKTVRASMGSVFSLSSKVEEYETLFRRRSELIVTAVNRAENIYDIEPGTLSSYILVIGSEAEGVSEEITTQAKRRIRVPMLNNSESLNVAVATGIIISHLNRDLIR